MKVKKSLFKFFALLSFLLFLLVGTFARVLVASTSTEPQFPNCEDKIFSSQGDKAHYDNGFHGIPGVGNLMGSDDVYTLDDGNYLQCFCPSEGTSGTQSNWWNVGKYSSGEISGFATQGWMVVANGLGWGLEADPYLVKNRSFSCSLPTPTPISSASPTNVQSTPTPGIRGPESKCYDLEAKPFEGTAPLTVSFTGHADDPATGGKIKEYKFDFADASGGQPQTVSQTDRTAYHRYELPGEYTAKLKVQDNAGNWRESGDCEVKVKVNATPKILGATTPQVLPATGISTVLGLVAALVFMRVGIYLYKRFRLV